MIWSIVVQDHSGIYWMENQMLVQVKSEGKVKESELESFWNFWIVSWMSIMVHRLFFTLSPPSLQKYSCMGVSFLNLLSPECPAHFPRSVDQLKEGTLGELPVSTMCGHKIIVMDLNSFPHFVVYCTAHYLFVERKVRSVEES